MKARQITIQVLVAVVSFAVGMMWQHSRTGLHISTIDRKDWTIGVGTITLEHSYETIGAHFLQPAISRISLKPDDGQRIVLFEGQPIFQEKYPIVKDISISEKVLEWTDGVRTYSLRIDSMSTKAD